MISIKLDSSEYQIFNSKEEWDSESWSAAGYERWQKKDWRTKGRAYIYQYEPITYPCAMIELHTQYDCDGPDRIINHFFYNFTQMDGE